MFAQFGETHLNESYNSRASRADDGLFEFSVSVDGACDVEDLLYATELYGFSLASLKIEKSEVGMSCRISLLQREGDLFALLVYLLIFFEDYNVYGLYSNI